MSENGPNFLCSMPVDVFFEEFLCELETPEFVADADFSCLMDGQDMKEIAERFIHAVELHNLCPSMRFFVPKARKKANIHFNADSERYTDIYPPLAARPRPKPRRGQKKKRDILEYLDFSNTLLGVELQPSEDADPFVDLERSETSSWRSSRETTPGDDSTNRKPSSSASQKEPPSQVQLRKENMAAAPDHVLIQNGSVVRPWLNSSDAGRASRTSLISHAHAQMSCQHRVFFFQLLLVGRWARFIRWDRAGAIVSERFDYVSDVSPLANFLWRFSHVSDEERGFDTTVTRATRSESSLLRTAIRSLLDVTERCQRDDEPTRPLNGADRTIDDTYTYPFWKIQVTNETSGESSSLIINRPFFAHPSICGRATRAYIAYDLAKHRLVFMKDSWRRTDVNLNPEFKTYEHLYSHDVSHLPHVLYGGDVVDTEGQLHETDTKFYSRDQNDKPLTTDTFDERCHHRITQDIAYGIDTARDAWEFLQAFHDVAEVIEKAFESAGTLHRDISLTNVMLTSDGRGILNDWDHAGTTDKLSAGIGTWQFMSIELQRDPKKRHDIEDDLESLFWVFLYVAAARFLVGKQAFPWNIFDTESTNPLEPTGWRAKRQYLMENIFQHLEFSPTAVHDLASDCATRWKDHYLIVEDRLEEFGDDVDSINTGKLARKPSFWTERFTAALDQLESGGGRSRTAHASGRKRKIDARDEVDAAAPRRSKRLKALRSRV